MKTSIKLKSLFPKNKSFLGNNFSKSLFNFIPKRTFLTKNSSNFQLNRQFLIKNQQSFLMKNLPKRHFSEILPKEKFSIELLLPNFDKFKMDFDDNSTFKDVANSIQKNFKFDNIEFRTWDHSNVALGNDLSSTLGSRKFVFLRIDTFEWQLVNYTYMRDNFKDAFDDYGNISLYLKDLSNTNDIVKNLENKIENDIKEIGELLLKYNNNPNLSVADLKNIATDLFKIENSIYLNKELSSFNSNKEIKAHNLSDLMEEYYRCKTEIGKFRSYEEEKKKTANLLAKILIYFAGLFFVAELYWIYWITFEVYSWDITEPMVYLLGFFNLTIIALLKIKLKGMTPHDYFGKVFLRMIGPKYKKTDMEHLDKLRKQVKDIEKFMSK